MQRNIMSLLFTLAMQQAWEQEALLLEFIERTVYFMERAPQRSGYEMDAVYRCFSGQLLHPLLRATLLRYQFHSLDEHLSVNLRYLA